MSDSQRPHGLQPTRLCRPWNFPVCCDPHKGFGIVNKAEVDVFLERSCFFDDPTDVGGEGNGTPLQYSCLENPMDGGAWKAAVYGVAKSQKRLSNFTFTFQNANPLQRSCLENPRDRGAWWASIYGVAQSRTRLMQLSSSRDSYSLMQRHRTYS